MRFSALVLSLFFVLPIVSSGVARGQEDAYQAARMSARRALEMANLELRLYLQVEYPRELRHLDAQIKLAEAEVKAYEARIREARPFDEFSVGRPLLLAIQDVKICLLQAELRLDDLRAERNASVRFHSDRWRLLELRAYEARARLAEIERGSQIVVSTAVSAESAAK